MRLLSLVLAGLCAQQTSAAQEALELRCPPSVRLEAPRLVQDAATAGFEGLIADRPIFLDGLGLYDGPPAQGASLKPASSRKKGHAEVTTWNLQGPFSSGKWFMCSYGRGLAQLTHKLPDTVSSCAGEASSTEVKGRIAVTLRCR
jgi:hypothetical protein